MKSIILLSALAIAFGLTGCASKATVASSPVLTAVTRAGCSAETSAINLASSNLASVLKCSNPSAITASIQTALGNANICQYAPAVQAQGMHAMGIVGNIICPVSITTTIGYISNQIPAAWGCSVSADAATVEAALTAACEAVVPY